MKLYFSPGACSMACHIALNEAGLGYEAVQVNLKTHQYGAAQDFYKKNTKGAVPALELNNGELLTEGAVILQFIADQKPETHLLGKTGTMERYRAQEWLNFVATELHKPMSLLWNDQTPEDFKTKVKERLSKQFNYLSNHFKGHEFLLGKQYTIADSYLFTILGWTRPLKVDLTAWPAILGFMERVQSRPATATTMKAEGLTK